MNTFAASTSASISACDDRSAPSSVMKPTLQFRLSQHLTLTPQLQQSIRLLQLSTVELNQEIERILMDNPILERDEADGEPVPAPVPSDAQRSSSEAQETTPEEAPTGPETGATESWMA